MTKVMKNVLKINAGVACSDRANEVEPRPNGGNVTINADFTNKN